MGQQPSRPRPAKHRTLPPDAKSLERMLRAAHADVLAKITHLKTAQHDGKSRRALQTLFQQRAAAWQKLVDIARQDPNVQIPDLEVHHEMVADKPEHC